VFRAARVIRPTCAAPWLLVQTAVLGQSLHSFLRFEQSLPHPLTNAQSSIPGVIFKQFLFSRCEVAPNIGG
jgi:hypothetical protein